MPRTSPIGMTRTIRMSERTVHDEVQAAASTAPLGAQVHLERGDHHGAEDGTERRSQATDDAHQSKLDRQVERQRIAGVQKTDVLRVEAATERGQERAERDRPDFEQSRVDADGLAASSSSRIPASWNPKRERAIHTLTA